MHGDIPRCWGILPSLAWVAFQDAVLCEELEVLPAEAREDGYEMASRVATKYIVRDWTIEYPTVKSNVGRMLLEALRLGSVRAWGLEDGSGDFKLIDAGKWQRLNLTDTHYAIGRARCIIAEPISPRNGQPALWSDIRIAADDVMREWPPSKRRPQRQSTKALIEGLAKALMEKGYAPHAKALADEIRPMCPHLNPSSIERYVRDAIKEWK